MFWTLSLSPSLPMARNITSFFSKSTVDAAAHQAIASFRPPPPPRGKGRPKKRDAAAVADVVVDVGAGAAPPAAAPVPAAASGGDGSSSANAAAAPMDVDGAAPAGGGGGPHADGGALGDPGAADAVAVDDADVAPRPKRKYVKLSAQAKVRLGKFVAEHGCAEAERRWRGPNGETTHRTQAFRVGTVYAAALAAANRQQPGVQAHPTPAQKIQHDASINKAAA